MMSFKQLKSPHPLVIRVAIFIVIIICSFYPSLFADKTVSPDAYFLLPYLDKINHLGDYFSQLFGLKTFDVQPVRDLSLWFDWMIFHQWGNNIFILHNAVLWLISGLFISKILEEENPNLSHLRSTFCVGLFLSYPIFAHIISFSMARKHILSFTLMVIATYYFLIFLKKYQWKYGLIFSFSYLLAVFSQPICLLWPLWATIYIILLKKNDFKKFIPYLIVLSIIFFIGFSANYIYYEQSVFFQSIFLLLSFYFFYKTIRFYIKFY
jgi:hypothetical protein